MNKFKIKDNLENFWINKISGTYGPVRLNLKKQKMGLILISSDLVFVIIMKQEIFNIKEINLIDKETKDINKRNIGLLFNQFK